MRMSLLAIAGIGFIVIASLGGAAAPDEKAAPAEKDELRRLMVQRYEAALGEMDARTELYNAGRVTLQDTCDTIRRFSSSGLEVAQTREYRLSLCEYALGRAQKIEESVKRKYEAELEPVQQFKRATYTRLDMEIKLHQVRAEPAADNAGKKADDSDLRPIHMNPPGAAGGALPSRT